MKRFIQLTIVLMLAMVLLLVACDPKIEPRHGDPLWQKTAITADNAFDALRAFFNDMETDSYGEDISISPDKPLLNLIGRPLAQLGVSDKESLEAKLLESGITTTWEDGKLTLTESLAEDREAPDEDRYNRGEYEMIQDDKTGDWTISASRDDAVRWGYTATLKKENEDNFVLVLTDREDERNKNTTTFYSRVCTYNSVVLKSDSFYYYKVNRNGVEVDIKEHTITTRYFVDKNIGNGDKVMEYEETKFESDVKRADFLVTIEFNHDKNGIPTFREMGKQMYPDKYIGGIQKMWVPASEGELQLPSTLTELGIHDFTIKAGSFDTAVYDIDSTYYVDVSYHDPSEDGKPNKPEKVKFMLSVKEKPNEVDEKILGARDEEGQPVFKEDETNDFDYVPISSSPIKGIDVKSDEKKTQLIIRLVDDPSTEANELDPFVALVN